MKRMKYATVTAKVFLHGSYKEVASCKATMTTDLPAASLGELLCDTVQEGWKQGLNPENYDVVISFS